MATVTPTFVRYDEKPSFLRITWAVFVGYLFGALVVSLAGLALLLLGIVGSSGTSGADPDGLLGWPYWRTGWWSALANATINLAIVGIAALCVRRTVADLAGRLVRLDVVLGALLVTGYVPVAAFDGALQLTGILALLVTAFLVRRFGVDGTAPRSTPVSHPSRRLVVLAAAAVGAIAFVATVAYGVTHPLWLSGAVWDETPAGQVDGRQTFDYPFAEGEKVAYTFSVDNRSFADATVVGIEAEPAGLLHLSGFRADDEPGGRVSSQDAAFAVPSRDHRWVTLTFRLSGCSPAEYGTHVVTHVTVRYRLLGATQTQYVPVVPAPSTRCR